jgi:hypothetical protein
MLCKQICIKIRNKCLMESMNFTIIGFKNILHDSFSDHSGPAWSTIALCSKPRTKVLTRTKKIPNRVVVARVSWAANCLRTPPQWWAPSTATEGSADAGLLTRYSSWLASGSLGSTPLSQPSTAERASRVVQ